MFTTRNLKAVGALLIAAACLSPNAAPGANHPKSAAGRPNAAPGANHPKPAAGRTNAARVQSTTNGYRQSHENNMMRRKNEARVQSQTKAKNFPSRIQLTPRVTVLNAPTGKTAKKTQPLTSVNRATRANPPNLNNLAQRAGNIRTKVGDQVVRDLNSSSAGAIENAMPGFASRGSKGAKGLKDSGRTANDRNPVTTAGSFDDFAGGGLGELSKGGKNKDTNASHNPDNSTTLIKKNGERTDVLEDGTIIVTYPNKTQHIYPVNEQSWIYIPPKGSKSNNDMVEYYKKHPGGTKGEPVDDPTGSGGSGEPVITAETLRGLRSRVSSKGEPTGDEATSGGAVDQSKTRQGRINQVGEPVPDSTVAKFAPSAMEVNQAIRIRLRNVNPVQH